MHFLSSLLPNAFSDGREYPKIERQLATLCCRTHYEQKLTALHRPRGKISSPKIRRKNKNKERDDKKGRRIRFGIAPMSKRRQTLPAYFPFLRTRKTTRITIPSIITPPIEAISMTIAKEVMPPAAGFSAVTTVDESGVLSKSVKTERNEINKLK